MEQVVPTLSERRPRFDLYTVLLHQIGAFDLLVEGIRLNLVNGRDTVVMKNKIDQSVCIEVAHTDSPTLPSR